MAAYRQRISRGTFWGDFVFFSAKFENVFFPPHVIGQEPYVGGSAARGRSPPVCGEVHREHHVHRRPRVRAEGLRRRCRRHPGDDRCSPDGCHEDGLTDHQYGQLRRDRTAPLRRGWCHAHVPGTGTRPAAKDSHSGAYTYMHGKRNAASETQRTLTILGAARCR